MNKNTTTLKDTYGTAYNNYKKGNFKIAETLCYKILSIDPNFIQSKILLANISTKNRDFIKTKKLLNEAFDMDPNNVSVLNNLGTVYRELGGKYIQYWDNSNANNNTIAKESEKEKINTDKNESDLVNNK